MGHTKVGSEIIDGVTEYLEYREGNRSLKTTEKELPGPAPSFTSRDIKRLRKDVFCLSQPLFARILNVEIPTIRAWEQGTRHPSGAALRLLEILTKNPGVLKTLKGEEAA